MLASERGINLVDGSGPAPGGVCDHLPCVALPNGHILPRLGPERLRERAEVPVAQFLILRPQAASQTPSTRIPRRIGMGAGPSRSTFRTGSR